MNSPTPKWDSIGFDHHSHLTHALLGRPKPIAEAGELLAVPGQGGSQRGGGRTASTASDHQLDGWVLDRKPKRIPLGAQKHPSQGQTDVASKVRSVQLVFQWTNMNPRKEHVVSVTHAPRILGLPTIDNNPHGARLATARMRWRLLLFQGSACFLPLSFSTARDICSWQTTCGTASNLGTPSEMVA